MIMDLWNMSSWKLERLMVQGNFKDLIAAVRPVNAFRYLENLCILVSNQVRSESRRIVNLSHPASVYHPTHYRQNTPSLRHITQALKFLRSWTVFSWNFKADFRGRMIVKFRGAEIGAWVDWVNHWGGGAALRATLGEGDMLLGAQIPSLEILGWVLRLKYANKCCHPSE